MVREGVTNVIRHSEAKHCWIRLEHGVVEISDDGRGPTARPDRSPATPDGLAEHSTGHEGHGLAGLRERVDAAGGTLTIGNRDGGGFVLRATT